MATESKRTRQMEVICLSLPRTGTMTIQHALQRLGYKRVWHADPETLQGVPSNHSSICNDLAVKKFRNGVRITRDELDEILGDCDATTDIPPCYFWDDMLAAYPEAKVIIVERDVNSWYQSCVINLLSTIFNTWHGWLLLRFAEPVLGVKHTTLLANMTFGFFRAQSWPELQQKAKSVYTQHYINVRQACREQQRPLLDFQLSDGWPKLCEFLDKPVPEGDFPRTNDGRSLNASITQYQWGQVRLAAQVVIQRVLAVACVTGLGWYWYRSTSRSIS